MIHTDMPNKKIHQGRNIKRFREMLGIKQDALAYELGEDWNQKKISLLEQKESVEKDILEQVAKILKVPTEAIENFDEEQAINVIANTFHDEAFIGNSGGTYHINPIEKIVQLHEEKIALYERMLKEKDEMMARLERLIGNNFNK
ncbi:helix-turn-helix domain-containing protein [Elizabethkingia occulta]|uniref:helix-turn-helix domain-containing protein n=1 Tax=Elizabethkingia occulta TaxID=1867263 RepID=UPI00398C4937